MRYLSSLRGKTKKRSQRRKSRAPEKRNKLRELRRYVGGGRRGKEEWLNLTCDQVKALPIPACVNPKEYLKLVSDFHPDGYPNSNCIPAWTAKFQQLGNAKKDDCPSSDAKQPDPEQSDPSDNLKKAERAYQEYKQQQQKEKERKWNEQFRNPDVFITKVYPNVGTFVGSFTGDSQEYGTMTFLNGDVYEGEWKNNKMQGKGTMKYADGGFYKGSWWANQRVGFKGQGENTMTYANGDKYQGYFYKDMKDGEGTMTYADGTVYNGKWQKDYPARKTPQLIHEFLQFIRDIDSDKIKLKSWNDLISEQGTFIDLLKKCIEENSFYDAFGDDTAERLLAEMPIDGFELDPEKGGNSYTQKIKDELERYYERIDQERLSSPSQKGGMLRRRKTRRIMKTKRMRN